MFDVIGVGDPAFSNYIVNSAFLTDLLIEDFMEAIDAGEDPDDVKYEIFANRNASTDDLTDLDKDRLEETISAYWENHNG